MNLDIPFNTLVEHLPAPPPGLEYRGAIDTYKSIPGIYISVAKDEYTLFGSFIPFSDVYFLQYPVSPDEMGIYYEFVENGVIEVPMKSSDIKKQVEATVNELSQTFQAFFNIFVPLTEVKND